MSFLNNLGIVVGLLSAALVMLEKQLPVPPQLTIEDLPDHLQKWRDRGKMYDVLGQKMFAMIEGKVV